MRSPSPTSVERLVGAIGVSRDLGDERDVLARGEARDQVVELEDEADVLAPVARERGLVGEREIVIAVVHVAAGRHVEPAEDVEQRRFAAARRAEQHDELALVEVEVDPAERDDVDLAHPVDLRQASRAEDRFHRISSRKARTCALRDETAEARPHRLQRDRRRRARDAKASAVIAAARVGTIFPC